MPSAVKNHKALGYERAPQFMAGLRGHLASTTDHYAVMVALTLGFAVQTGWRIGDILIAPKSQIDRDERVWVIPNPKRHEEHRELEHKVPLTPQVLEILDRAAAISGDGELLFTNPKSGKPLGKETVRLLAKKLSGDADLTTHGFRSCLYDWARDKTAFDVETINFVLGHIGGGDEVVEAYRRRSAVDKRRKLMEAWSDYLDGVEVATGEVIDIGSRR
jgi:integrase